MGGVSEGPYASLNLGILTDDHPDRVRENRRRAVAAAGLAPERVALGWQVHGTDLCEWTEPPVDEGIAPAGSELARVDGHATAEKELGLLVLAADCLPLALIAPGRVAMVHCGWRGLAGGIVERALEGFHEPPAAALGPRIGRCCYEVGPEVLAPFEDLEGVAEGPRLDLGAVARRQLERGGVGRIEDLDLCTSCRPDLFFSHRRDHGLTGRQGGLAWLTS
jgi:hypothetical protein